MSVFVDANVVLYAAVPDNPPAPACIRLLDAVLDGRLDGKTSTAVIEEVFHVELRSTELDLRGVAGVAYAMFTPLLAVTDETIKLALDLDLRTLGSNDRVHAATCRLNGIDTIVSVDRGFDGVDGLSRIDPLDTDAVARLLG